MGEPAPLSREDRAAMRALAAAVVASVEDDAEMAHGLHVIKTMGGDVIERQDVEILIMQLCQALNAEREDFCAAVRLLYRAVEGGPWTAADNRSASALYKLAEIET